MKEKEIKIIAAAKQLFIIDGIQGTATATIAEKAGVSNGTLFHYYKTKSSLIQVIYQQTKLDQVDQILNGVEELSGIREKIHLLYTQWIKWSMKNEEDYKFCQQFENSIFYNTKAEDLGKRLIAVFMEISEKGIQQKVLCFMPPDMLYELTKSNVLGMVGYLKKNPVKYRTPEFMKNVFDLYWKMFQF